MKNTPEARQADIVDVLSLIADTLLAAHKDVTRTRVALSMPKSHKGTKRSLIGNQLDSISRFHLILGLHCETLEFLIKKENEA